MPGVCKFSLFKLLSKCGPDGCIYIQHFNVTCLLLSSFHLQQSTCDKQLRSESWSSCSQLINPQPYIQACVLDMCSCTSNSSDSCVCDTLSEFSRQCSHAGGQPPNWRNTQFCGNDSCFCQKLLRNCAWFALLGFIVTEEPTSVVSSNNLLCDVY